MKTRKRMSAMVMAFIIAFTAGYTPVAAAEHIHDETCGYKAEVPCGHTTHDENCGYAEATEGSACSHEHDENCYHQVTNCQHIHADECYGDVSDASPSDAAEPENCSHICSEEDGCITEELDCPHIHDRDCGYAPAADEQPCKHAQGEHDETCGYVPAAPCNVPVGSRLVRRILQKTNEVPKAETLLKTAECVVSSEIANTQESVTNWIKTTWLSGILVLDDALGIEYDVGIEDLQIATLGDAFTAAEDGTEENQEGTAGKFTFSVVVPGIDGVAEPRLTVQKTCTITPIPYTPPQIGVTGTELPPATVGEAYSFSLDSLLADNFSAEFVSWALASNTTLPGGLSFTTGDGMISGTPTTTGQYSLNDIKAEAVGGEYQTGVFNFALTVYAADQYPRPNISASGETVELRDAVVHVDQGNTVHLQANLSQNAPEYSLQWQKKQEGENAFASLADATAKELNIEAGDYPSNTQFRCVATYAGTIERESAPVTLRYRPSDVLAIVTGNVTTENGTPLYGRAIEIIDENNNVIGSGEIGENGEYSISDVPDGDYFFNISGVERIQNGSISIAEGNVTGNTNHAISAGNIEGATSKDVLIPGAGNATIEFVSGGNLAGGSTVDAAPYSPTDDDISHVLESAYPEGEANMAEEVNVGSVEILNNSLLIIGNDIFHVFGKLAQIVKLNGQNYVVTDIQERKAFLQSWDKSEMHVIDRNGNIVEASKSDFDIFDIHEENTIVIIDEAQYCRKFKTNTRGSRVNYIYLPDSMEPAGIYYEYDDRTRNKAIFNKGCDPDSVRQQQIADFLALINTKIGKTHYMSNAFSYDINILGGRARSNGAMGTIGISGIENADKSISVHLSSSGYDEGELNKNGDGFFWTVSDTSPFMIFTFPEANMEIPVTTITPNSGDNSGNDGSSSDGDSSSDSTYNPDILQGTWIRTDTGIWKFRLTSGAYAKSRWGLVDGLWYYFDGEGKMLTGWQFLNNRWYYLCTEETSKLAAGRKEGAMLTGWYYDPMYQGWFYLDTSGAMLTGWKEIGGRWYYFYENGVMAADTEVDGYKLGPDGAWIV